ncbi:MAG TPA: oxygenase MpaB family protein [Solirubrobacterales bacterium]|nr:oxygenase MpaB family protein [Solirubrobacterales bacterium]
MARKWIAAEIAWLDPIADSQRVVLLSANRLLPPLGKPFVFNLLYSLGFLRICGQLEGARAVDRDGEGKIHREGDRRAVDTMHHFASWIQHGPRSEESTSSLARVKRMHDHYADRYSFSNETFLHTIALFTVQFDHLLTLIGAPGYSEAEKQAHVVHWRSIGELLGVREMPETWEGMERVLERYEGDPAWFGQTPEGHRSAEALIVQFACRWLPPGLRWTARPLLLSLLDDHVLRAIDEPKPPRPLVWMVRASIRTGLCLGDRLLPEPREPFVPLGEV